MRWIATTIVLAAALTTGATAGEAASRKASSGPALRPDRIDIRYGKPESPDHQPIYRLLTERHALEQLRDLLRPFRLPHRLLLQTRGCDGIANAWSDEESVTVCYEYLDDIWKNAADRTTPADIAPVDTLIGPFVDVFLHEAGHSVFKIFQTPLFGREEDAADQFSTYIMLRFEKDEARRLIMGSAYQYKADVSDPNITVARQKFADEHGTPAQRFYNILCTAYGADPKLFADFVEKKFLPEERAVGCEYEYKQVAHAFDTLIRPHIDRRLVKSLYKRWLTPVTTKPRPWRSP